MTGDKELFAMEQTRAQRHDFSEGASPRYFDCQRPATVHRLHENGLEQRPFKAGRGL